jgi:2-oxoglutarate/2-oxoacid ferredoxin oxidoreductase subunit beta
MAVASKLIENNFRMNRLPHIWCPGCGHGIIMRGIAEAIENLGYDKQKVCIISGIGCSSRAPGYMDFNTLHTTHGRALAFATGVKLANPELKVIVISGDGDATAIGGNHLIHAARRNIDITTIIFNNNIYGMTGGQYSPTTPHGELGTTAPYGNVDNVFDICRLAEGAGATYVARGTVYHAKQLEKNIENALENKGFSVVEGISICPTYYGRKNRKGNAAEMMINLKDTTLDKKVAAKLPPEKTEGKLIIGEFVNKIQPEFCEEYHKVVDKFTKED